MLLPSNFVVCCPKQISSLIKVLGRALLDILEPPNILKNNDNNTTKQATTTAVKIQQQKLREWRVLAVVKLAATLL